VVHVQDALSTLASADAAITFFGHTHIQGLFRLNSGLAEAIYPEYPSIAKAETWKLELQSGTTYMINPGSVGQPRDGDWRASYVVFDEEKGMIRLRRLRYDLPKTQEKILLSGLPPRLAERLAFGK